MAHLVGLIYFMLESYKFFHLFHVIFIFEICKFRTKILNKVQCLVSGYFYLMLFTWWRPFHPEQTSLGGKAVLLKCHDRIFFQLLVFDCTLFYLALNLWPTIQINMCLIRIELLRSVHHLLVQWNYGYFIFILLQIEYLPISSWEKSQQIMGEFYDIWQEALSRSSLPGCFAHMLPNFAEFGLGDQYTPQHTSVQYATIMAQMIASAQSAQTGRN